MKVKYYLLSALLAGGLLASCSNNEEVQGKGTDGVVEEASISITLSGSKAGTRAMSTEAGTDAENEIKDFAVYVFDQNGTLEKHLGKTVPTNQTTELTKTITGLVTGPKTIVVLANLNGGYPTYVDGTAQYTDLVNISKKILDEQSPAYIAVEANAQGLVMSGELDKNLVKGTNTAIVPVERVVSKIKIGTVKVNEIAGHDKAFVLQNVHIMRAKSHATVNPGIITTTIETADGYYGGLRDDDYATKTKKDYLTEDLTPVLSTMADTPTGLYFYVYPNDNVSEECTLMVFEGTYDGNTLFYPFRINDKIVVDSEGTGEYIKRNTVHTINVTFEKPGNGSSNPEVPLDPADLTVTVEPAEWLVVPTQSVTW